MNPITDKQRKAITFIERKLEIKFNGTTKQEAWIFIHNNLENAQKCSFFESMISIPIFSCSYDRRNGHNIDFDYDTEAQMSKNLMIRDLQKGKDPIDVFTNFYKNDIALRKVD
jgi:hypothetical protein